MTPGQVLVEGGLAAVGRVDLFKRVLSKHPSAQVGVYSWAGDREAYQYGDQLAAAIKAAGWAADSRNGNWLGGGPPRGLVLQLRAGSGVTNMEVKELAALRPQHLVSPTFRALAEALAQAGLETTYSVIEGGTAGGIELLVGYKP